VKYLKKPVVPSVGDKFILVTGCRTVAHCQFFENIANFQGFNLLTGQIGVLNTKEEQD
jgi:hypothetical protein